MKLFSKLADLFFVPKCVFCGKVLDEGQLCRECRASLPYLSGTLKGGEFYSEAVAALRYEGDVRKSLHRYKFSGRSSYATQYASLVAEAVEREISGRYGIITWVPVSPKRLRKRGYDQSRLIAEEMAKRLNCECAALLKKTRENAVQSTLTGREKRNANVMGVYTAVNEDKIKKNKILLVDDIITTGATLSESARTLLMAGAEDVVCAAVASAGKKK